MEVRRDELSETLFHQSADGSFGWDDRVADAAIRWSGHDRDSWRRTIETSLPGSVAAGSREQVVRTVVALLIVSLKFPDREAIWRRAYQKSCRHYLAKALGKSAHEVEGWLNELRQKLAAEKQQPAPAP